MTTVDEAARSILASVGTDADAVLVAAWINERYQEMATRYKFRHLYESASINISGGDNEFDTGVTDIQFFARVRYFDGSSYVRDVNRVTVEELDEWFPTRGTAASSTGPYYYADIGLDAGGTQRRIEIYPTAQENGSEALTFNYYEVPAALQISSTLPRGIYTHDIKEGVLLSWYRAMHAKAIIGKDYDAATQWMSMVKEQEPKWEAAMLRAVQADSGKINRLRYPET